MLVFDTEPDVFLLIK